MQPLFVSLAEKPVGKPDALIGHVRFDERGWETGRRSGVSARAHPRLYTSFYKEVFRTVRTGDRLRPTPGPSVAEGTPPTDFRIDSAYCLVAAGGVRGVLEGGTIPFRRM
jgi:hypothetical protein